MATYTMADIEELSRNYHTHITGEFGDDSEFSIDKIRIAERNILVTGRVLGTGINQYLDYTVNTRDYVLVAESTSPISGRGCFYVDALSRGVRTVTLLGQTFEENGASATLVWLSTSGLSRNNYSPNTTTRHFTETIPRYNLPPSINNWETTFTLFSAMQHHNTYALSAYSSRYLEVSGVPVFVDKVAAQNYINSGVIDRSKLINQGSDSHPLLYIRSKAYAQREDREKILASHNELEIESYGRTYKNICGYVDNRLPHNITLKWINGVTYRRRSLTDAVPTWSEWSFDELVEGSTITRNYTYTGEYDYLPWGKCIGELSTNIPIFASEQDADDWLDPDIPDEDKPTPLPVPEPEPEPEPDDPDNPSDGDDVEENEDDISNRTIGGSFTTLYTGTLASILAVARKLYDPDETIISQIKKGVEWWGENPINFIVRQYYCPININSFGSVNEPTNTVYFGRNSFEINGSISKVATTGNVIDFASAMVKGTYDDYRDDMYCNFGLYLPFLGVVPLNKSLYLNKRLSVKVAFDMYTHVMKYYLFSNGKLMESHECNIGVDLPVMGSDYMKKLNENISGITSIATGVVSTGIGIGTLSKGVGKLDLDGNSIGKNLSAPNITNGISSIADGLSDLLGREETIRNGSISSSTAIHDILYPYIIIETQHTIKPTSNIYGLPDNDINTLGTRTGFIKVTDVKLTTTATLEERNMIQQLLSNGVYI